MYYHAKSDCCPCNRRQQILLAGCDPKADSTRMLLNSLNQKTVLNTLRSEGDEGVDFETVLQPGFGGIKCVEPGGPEQGFGCVGRGIITSIGLLENDQSNDLIKNLISTVSYRNPETYYLIGLVYKYLKNIIYK